MTFEVLADLFLSNRINQHWQFSGLDSYDVCFDKQHFKQYPHEIRYCYNSRGFRDAEWPRDNLAKATWCLGDSFTVGLGAPIAHTWPYLLQQTTQCQTINVAMDGASNNWIARRACDILRAVQPRNMVIMLSFAERREDSLDNYVNTAWYNCYQDIRGDTWPDPPLYQDFHLLPESIRRELQQDHTLIFGRVSDNGARLEFDSTFDEERRQQWVRPDDENLVNFVECVQQIQQAQGSTNIVWSIIPGVIDSTVPALAQEFAKLMPHIPPFKVQDLARDGFHFDIITAQWFADQVAPLLKLQ